MAAVRYEMIQARLRPREQMCAGVHLFECLSGLLEAACNSRLKPISGTSWLAQLPAFSARSEREAASGRWAGWIRTSELSYVRVRGA